MTTSICSGASGSTSGGGTCFEDRVEERLQVRRRDGQVGGGDALPAGGVDRREVERGVVGVQFDEQVEDLVEHFGRAGRRGGRSC